MAGAGRRTAHRPEVKTLPRAGRSPKIEDPVLLYPRPRAVTATSRSSAPSSGSRRRIRARVALVLLETLRSQDRPGEVLDDENVSITLPRRLGLSEVVDRQIRNYRAEARRRRRLPESEVLDLMRLVLKRPDADEVFFRAGEVLHGDHSRSGLRRLLPRRYAVGRARRRARRLLRHYFGGPVVRTPGKEFVLEADPGLLLDRDAPGEACALITGFANRALAMYVADPPPVLHSECRRTGGEHCLWRLRTPQASDG